MLVIARSDYARLAEDCGEDLVVSGHRCGVGCYSLFACIGSPGLENNYRLVAGDPLGCINETSAAFHRL